MRKRHLTILTLIFSACLLLFACRKDFRNFINDQEVPAASLELAKIFYTQQTQNDPIKSNLRPLWSDSWSVKKDANTTEIVVPTAENKVSNKNIQIRRVFLFTMHGTRVSTGKVVEFVGQRYDVTKNLDKLIQEHDHNAIENFNGSIISYTLGYFYMSGTYFHNGSKTNEKVLITKNVGRIIDQTNSTRFARKSVGAGRGRVSGAYDNFVYDPRCDYWVHWDGAGIIDDVVMLGCEDSSNPFPGDTTGEGSGEESGEGSGSGDTVIPPYGGTGYFVVFFKNVPRVDLAKLLKCFDNIPDQGAIYSMKLCVDIPNNADATDLLSWDHRAGHVFITMTKKNGNKTMSKSFGFYPSNPLNQFLSITDANVGSKMVDDGNSEFNSSYEISTTNKETFLIGMANATTKASLAYNLYNNNCADYGVSVFEAYKNAVDGSAANTIGVQNSTIDLFGDVGRTPAGVQQRLMILKNENKPGVSISSGTSPARSGVCPL